jgi:NADPH-dependent FMN reductase
VNIGLLKMKGNHLMKVSAILGSPKKGGTIDMLIDEALAAFSEKGFETEKIDLYNIEIKPCVACFVCTKGKPCSINDDCEKVLASMGNSDVVIMGSPTYWSNVTSPVKALFDRGMGFFEMTKMGPVRREEKPKQVLLLTACTVPFPLNFLFWVSTGCIKAMKVFFKQTRARIYCMTVTNTKNIKEARMNKLKEKAVRIAQKLAVKV